MDEERFVLEALPKDFMFEVVRQFSCEKCNHWKLTTFGILKDESTTAERTIGKLEAGNWLKRIQSSKAKPVSPYKQNRAMVHIGAWTQLIATDTAKVYKQILKRFKDG